MNGWNNSFPLLLLTGMLLYLPGCHRRPAPPSEITIATFSHAIDYSPFYVAKHFGWFEGSPELKGIRVRYRELNDRAEISSAIEKHQLQAVFAAEPPVILTSAQGERLKITEISCTLQQEVVVRSRLPIYSVPDLRHHSIAVLLGTSSHYGLLKILRSAQLDPDRDVKLLYMSPDEARAAFESGRIDAWAVWPPFVEQEEVSGRGRVLTGGDAVINSVMAVPQYVLENNEPVARAMVQVIQRSKDWIRGHPEESENVVASELGLDMSVVQVAWGKHDWSAHLTPAIMKDIQQKANFLSDEHLTRNDARIDIKRELIDARYSPK
jgi:sulfonate transport system substrate-binding protein